MLVLLFDLVMVVAYLLWL